MAEWGRKVVWMQGIVANKAQRHSDPSLQEIFQGANQDIGLILSAYISHARNSNTGESICNLLGLLAVACQVKQVTPETKTNLEEI